jgi:CRP-like cAMP-binding protein
MNFFSRDPRRDELRRIPIFSELSGRDLDVLARHADPFDVPAGTRLIREGAPGREFFAIADGEVEISKDGQPVACEGDGDYFGEIALLHDVPRTATVTTTKPTRLFVLTDRAFRTFVAPRLALYDPDC